MGKISSRVKEFNLANDEVLRIEGEERTLIRYLQREAKEADRTYP